MSITIRALEPTEWAKFKEFRLAALKAQPGVFFTSYEEAAKRTPEEWQKNVRDTAHQVFGLFDGEKLIGVTAASAYWEEDPSGATAILGMSYILPEYRGRSLSRMLFAARLGWIRRQPQFTRVLVHHRASNQASAHAIKANGFTRIGTAMQPWPDGTSEEEIIYEMKL